MTTEELLLPRVICTSTGKLHYPGSPFEIGDILILKMYADGKEKYGILDDEGFPEILMLKRVVDDCPHLFKRLEWWQERKESDMPEYVKDDNGIYKVEEWHTNLAPKVSVAIDTKIHQGYEGYVRDSESCPLYSDFLPATKEEYENQNK